MNPSSARSTGTNVERDLAADAADLHRAVGDLVRIYQFRDRKSLCYYNISVTQCYALSTIVTRGPLTQNDLAESLYLDKSTASRLVAALVAHGYVRRAADRRDGRVRNLTATPRGVALHEKIEQDLIKEMRELIADQDRRTRRSAIALVLRLAASAKSRFKRMGLLGRASD